MEFLEAAPYLIVVFRIDFGLNHAAECETKTKHYYVQESVCIPTGFLLAALHMSGVATLTHTPSPMGFLSSILGRPKNEHHSSCFRSVSQPRTRRFQISPKRRLPR